MGTRLGNAEDTARIDNLTATATGRAGFGAGTRFGTRTLARLAAFRLGDGDLFLAAVGRFLEGDLHIIPEIVTPPRLRGIGPAAAKKIVENVAAAAEDFPKYLERIVKAAAVSKGAGATIKGRVAVLVVSGALLRVAQGFVGLAQLLELLFRSFVARILVRMVLRRELAVCLLDFLRHDTLLYAEDFVIITFGHWSGGGLFGHDDAGRTQKTLP